MADAAQAAIATAEEAPIQGTAFVVGARIKEHIKTKECRTTGDFVAELNKQVTELIDKAVKRCKDNGRGTVGARDL